MDWKTIRDNKLARRESLLNPYKVLEDKIPPIGSLNDVSDFIDQSDLLKTKYKTITNYSIAELLDLYVAGKLTVEETVTAYCYRAVLAHQLVNFLSEVRFQEAIKEARELDKYFKETGKLKGPLHGITISLKDNINVKGLASSMGVIGLCEDIKIEDAAIVKLLKDQGGIILCKSNCSQGMLFTETRNGLWGRTLNPHNRKYLNVGGSSGGAGAGAALKSTCISIGSDAGGSVRHPAALNFVYSIKPSDGRTPTFGTESLQQGLESLKTVYGILSSDLKNVEYAFKTIVDAKPYLEYDASCLPLPYRDVEIDFTKPLTFGFLDRDGLTTATPPVLRGLEIVKNKLIKAGHTVIDWPDTYMRDIAENGLFPFFGVNGFKIANEIFEKSGEPKDPEFVEWFSQGKDIQVSELWKMHEHRTELVQKYLKLWNTYNDGKRIDAIITPCSPFPACLIGHVVPTPFTAVWNALDYSATTFPVTKCDVSVDRPITKTEFISKIDERVHKQYATELQHFENGPVSLQVVCNKLEEEKSLEITKYVSSLLK